MGVAVPALVKLRIAKAEVASEIDDRAAVPEPHARLLRGLTRWKRRKHNLGVPHVRTHDERIRGRVQVGLDGAKRLSLMRARHRRYKSRLGMPQHQTRELATRVASNTNDRDAGRHTRRIMRPVG